MISHEQNIEYLAWANEVLGSNFIPTQSAWITRLMEDGAIAAVVIFNMFTEHNVEISVATDRTGKGATRDFIAVCYRYAFIQCKKRRVTFIVEVGNDLSLRMARKLGHAEEARLIGWFGKNDGIVFRMLREECRWI